MKGGGGGLKERRQNFEITSCGTVCRSEILTQF